MPGTKSEGSGGGTDPPSELGSFGAVVPAVGVDVVEVVGLAAGAGAVAGRTVGSGDEIPLRGKVVTGIAVTTCAAMMAAASQMMVSVRIACRSMVVWCRGLLPYLRTASSPRIVICTCLR